MSANSTDATGINQLLAIKYNHQNNSLELVDDDITNEEVADVLFDLATTYSDVTYLNLSGAQYISLLMILIASIFLYRFRQKKYKWKM